MTIFFCISTGSTFKSYSICNDVKIIATIYFAENGLEVVEFVYKKCPDLVLMDIQMPVMDGVEACKKIKQNHPDLPVIAVTANAMAADVELYHEEGFDGYLSKPVDVGQLNAVLAQYLTVETE